MPKAQERILVRPPWERMMQIHEGPKGNRYPNGSGIAKAIEVSTRATKRDIDFMKSRLRLRLNNIEEIEQWVLSWGLHATVVRPAELATRIRTTVAGLAQRYAD